MLFTEIDKEFGFFKKFAIAIAIGYAVAGIFVIWIVIKLLQHFKVI